MEQNYELLSFIHFNIYLFMYIVQTVRSSITVAISITIINYKFKYNGNNNNNAQQIATNWSRVTT